MGLFSSSWNPKKDTPSLAGKVAIVTGGNMGIGYETALALVAHGAKVYFTVRSAAKGQDTLSRMEEALPALKGTGMANFLILDLSSVRGTKKVAEEFLGKENRLDILVNNAAMSAGPYLETEEGISTMMASNYLGHFVFTTTLLPLLEKTASEPGSDVRVVNVSSAVHTGSPPTKFESIADFRNPCRPAEAKDAFLTSVTRYSQSKLANILFTKELQRRWDEAGVSALTMALHPGGVATEGSKSVLGVLYPVISLFFSAPEQGAYTSLFAATSVTVRQEPKKYAGVYLSALDKVSPPSKNALDPQAAKALWELSESVEKSILERGTAE